MPTESKSVPERIVDLMYKMAGSHPGSRPVHAKGLVCQGTFRASGEAPRMSRAAHLRGQPVPATIRFANSSGDPNVHDGQPNVRSMAVKLQVAGGKPADIVANSIEGSVAAITGCRRPARALLTPEVGCQRGPNFLREELAERLARGPAGFRLTLQVAADGDPTDDPTALWPADRPTAELGRLEIGSISPTSAADEQRLIFDPANVADGIELSADPILLARSPAYGVSYARRNPKA